MANQPSDVSQLLQAWGRGNVQAREELVPLVYRELKRRAGAYLRHERPDHTLQATALVHEAYVRLVGWDRVAGRNRAQFFSIASQMMRRILVDHARERLAAKRPGADVRVTLVDHAGATPAPDCDLILLDQVLDELAHHNARQAQIVEMRYFGGLSEMEVGAVLDVSRATVTREWQAARLWLYRRMTKGKDSGH